MRSDEDPGQRTHVDAHAGDDAQAPEHVGELALAGRAQAGDDDLDGRAGGDARSVSCWPTAPRKMMFVASPRIFGPRTASVTLMTASTRTTRIRGRSGRSSPRSRRSVPLKSFDFWGGRPMPMPNMPGPPPGRRMGGPAGAAPGPPAGAPCPPAGAP